METEVTFHPRTCVAEVEEGTRLAPRFDADGLIPVVTTCATTGDVLMHSHMNREALARTIESGEAHYWSRSRQTVWRKGEASGLIQRVKSLRVDDDQDCVWIQVDVASNGASCHVGYRSCFYREVPVGPERERDLVFVESSKVFDPKEVYGDIPNPTKL